MRLNYNHFLYLLAAFILLFVALIVNDFYGERSTNRSVIINNFEKNLITQSDFLQKKSDEIFALLEKDIQNYWPLLERVDESNDFSIYLYQHDSLLYWNNSNVYFDLVDIPNQTFLIQDVRSWYLGIYSQLGDYRMVLLEPVYQSYKVENQYVNKVVNPKFSNSNSIEISPYFHHQAYPLKFIDGKTYYISLNQAQMGGGSKNLGYVFILLFYVLIGILSLYVSQSYLKNTKYYMFNVFFALLIIIIVRLFDIQLDFASRYFDSYLLTKAPYSGLYLGDLLIWLEIFLLFSIIVYSSIMSNHDQKTHNDGPFHIASFVQVILINLCSYFLYSIIVKTGLNSIDSFEFSSPMVFNIVYTVFSGLLLYISIRIIGKTFIRLQYSKLFVLILIVQSIIVSTLLFKYNFVLYLIPLALIGFSFFMEDLSHKLKQFYVLHHILYIILVSASLAVVVNYSFYVNKTKEQLQISTYLSRTGDDNIEDFWAKFEREISEDKIFNQLSDSLNPQRIDSLLDYIEHTYFLNSDISFDYQITYCNSGDSLRIDNQENVSNCFDYFNNLKEGAKQISNDDIYLLSDDPDNIYYYSDIPLDSLNKLFFEFYSYFVPGGLAYAELLIDKKPGTPDLSDYSYARYKSGALSSKFGEFEYHTTISSYDEYEYAKQFELNNYIHLKVKVGNDVLLVSRPVTKISSRIFIFSFLFIFIAILVLLLTMALYGSDYNQLFNLNLRARLQMFFMFALSTILLITTIIILYYTNISNTNKLHADLNEKAHSVLIELQHKLQDYNSLEEVKESEIFPLLQKFSLVFFSDINLYDTHGRLVASSRPQIFTEGFLSEVVNPRAYEEILVDNLLFYNCTEKIGSLEYYSTYLPLMLSSDRPSGIINLPYFARQTKQTQSFRFMLFTFINLFVILGILGTIVAVLYSRLLTRPLSVLQQNISNIRIDMKNEKIKWNKNDEIGQLIDEYNNMVDKLEASSELLKRSEREIAWREVARQIAHEIKNPLTPMKLNIQYLLRARGENPEDFDTKFKDISNTLIEQIETLNNVAEMFSDMAKPNTRDFEEVDLYKIINSVVSLFNKTENLSIEIAKTPNKADFKILGNPKDLNRIFNNLLKNSSEAIDNYKDGKINIEIVSHESYVDVVIKDNGKGIPEKVKKQIFTPYFTTRSKGTGLGLAIVKSLLSSMGGNISLVQSDHNGTIFKIRFVKK